MVELLISDEEIGMLFSRANGECWVIHDSDGHGKFRAMANADIIEPLEGLANPGVAV